MIEIGRMKRRVSHAGGPNLRDGEGAIAWGHCRRAMMVDIRSEVISSFVLKTRFLTATPRIAGRMWAQVAKNLQTGTESRFLIS
jgi:hypothetical protein